MSTDERSLCEHLHNEIDLSLDHDGSREETYESAGSGFQDFDGIDESGLFTELW